MNFVAYDAAYSLYPRATFEERESLVLLQDQGFEVAEQPLWQEVVTVSNMGFNGKDVIVHGPSRLDLIKQIL